MANSISRQTLQRLPVYLNYLKGLQEKSGYISASTIASALNLNDVQVRKDLAMITSSGRPKIGYPILDLIDDLEVYLGYRDVSSAVLVGAGHLGKALLNYSGFKTYGLEILAAFDTNEAVVDRGKGSIKHLNELSEFCRQNNPRIGIITVPARAAQKVCNLLIDCGIKAIWNFAPVHLSVPNNVVVANENMAINLALISHYLRQGTSDETSGIFAENIFNS